MMAFLSPCFCSRGRFLVYIRFLQPNRSSTSHSHLAVTLEPSMALGNPMHVQALWAVFPEASLSSSNRVGLHTAKCELASRGFCRQNRLPWHRRRRIIRRLQRILLPKMFFSFVKKCKFRQKFCHTSRISPVFRHPKMRPFQQCKTVTAVNLFYEVLSKQFEAFGFYFSQEKNRW